MPGGDVTARVYDLRPRLDAAARERERERERPVRAGRARLLDALFAAGLLWTAWRTYGRPRP